MYIFNDLTTYDQCLRLAAQIEMAVENFPKSTDYFSSRLTRSAKSIHVHYLGAHKSGEADDAKNHFWKARASVEECIGMVEVAYRQGFLPPSLKDRFRIELSRLSAEFQKLIRMTSPGGKPAVSAAVSTN